MPGCRQLLLNSKDRLILARRRSINGFRVSIRALEVSQAPFSSVNFDLLAIFDFFRPSFQIQICVKFCYKNVYKVVLPAITPVACKSNMKFFTHIPFILGFLAVLHPSCNAKVCNVLDYGAVADGQTDVGPAIIKAFNDCKTQTTGDPADTVVLVPRGDYSIGSNVVMMKGKAITFTFDGTLNLIYSTTLTKNMISFIRFEQLVVNGKGRFNGNGMRYRPNGSLKRSPQRPRLVRIENSIDVDYSGFNLFESPMYHLTLYNVTNANVHDFEIHGPDIGTTDGITVAGWNISVHDVVVEGGDECVSVKSPSDGVTVKDVTCIKTDGCSLGSMGPGARGYSINNVRFENINLTDASNGIIVKSYKNAQGAIDNLTCINFSLTRVAYAIKLDSSWGNTKWDQTRFRQKRALAGQRWTNFRFISFRGTAKGPRQVVTINCDQKEQCTGLVFKDIQVTGTKIPKPKFVAGCGSYDSASTEALGPLRAC
ncbi:hypothetical protein O181_016845 [Austropuccinia psidii MF-1]|uniref:Glycoside hydrolase family 28 protein n=1 Tax=Austropuccinia psidii MF-1 TaxID=1389203 RepID=A0A9Q3GSF0_9BASI|nr:hypothetical protein [Austropuccinia psidii MF-1]